MAAPSLWTMIKHYSEEYSIENMKGLLYIGTMSLITVVTCKLSITACRMSFNSDSRGRIALTVLFCLAATSFDFASLVGMGMAYLWSVREAYSRRTTS